MSLLSSTRKKLVRAVRQGVSLAEISRHSGGRVDYEWLKKFWASKIVEPGVNRTESLHNVLVGLESLAIVEAGTGKRRA